MNWPDQQHQQLQVLQQCLPVLITANRPQDFMTAHVKVNVNNNIAYQWVCVCVWCHSYLNERSGLLWRSPPLWLMLDFPSDMKERASLSRHHLHLQHFFKCVCVCVFLLSTRCAPPPDQTPVCLWLLLCVCEAGLTGSSCLPSHSHLFFLHPPPLPSSLLLLLLHVILVVIFSVHPLPH